MVLGRITSKRPRLGNTNTNHVRNIMIGFMVLKSCPRNTIGSLFRKTQRPTCVRPTLLSHEVLDMITRRRLRVKKVLIRHLHI